MISHERLLFASVSDALNLNRMKFAPGAASVFDAEFITLTTGDSGIHANVSSILSAANITLPVNLDALPDTAALGVAPLGQGRGPSVWALYFASPTAATVKIADSISRRRSLCFA